MVVSDKKTRTLISIEKELKAKLEEMAAKENRSFNNLVETILKRHVEEQEG